MPLTEIELDLPKADLSVEIQEFLQEANRRCDAFFESGAFKKLPRFLPADYAAVCAVFQHLGANHPLLGNRFCEWGSGLGTATCLAALLGFEAYGVEIEPDLVRHSRKIANDCQLEATFLNCSFLPEGYDFLSTQGGNELIMPSRSQRRSTGYEDLEWTLDEVDLFYVYPWPEEQESTLELFENVASDGAYLVCFFGHGDICVYRLDVD